MKSNDVKKRSKLPANPIQWQEVVEARQWISFVDNRPELQANFTQAYNWGVFYKELGQLVFYRVAVDQQILAGYIAVLEKAKTGSFLSIAGGPLLDWLDDRLLDSFLEDVSHLARRHRCTFVRFKPAVGDSSEIRQRLARRHLRRSPAPFSVEYAGWLDLKLDDRQLMENMSQSLRRKIRQAQKDQHIEITRSQKEADAQEFARLHQEHARRLRYAPFSCSRLVRQFMAFAADDQAVLYIARRRGEILAANMIFFYGREASYHFGISTPLGQKYSSAPLLHLAAIKDARRRQMTIYNLWGITDVDATSHRYFGLSQFKRSFGIIEHRYVPAHDLVIRPALYYLAALTEMVRRRCRRL